MSLEDPPTDPPTEPTPIKLSSGDLEAVADLVVKKLKETPLQREGDGPGEYKLVLFGGLAIH